MKLPLLRLKTCLLLVFSLGQKLIGLSSVAALATTLTASIVLLGNSAQAQSWGAYNLYAQGSLRAVGLGGASTALSDSASGVLSNPAGIVMGEWSATVDSSNNPVDDEDQATGISNDANFIFAGAATHIGKNWAIAVGYTTPFAFESKEFFFDSGSSVSVEQNLAIELTGYDLAISRRFGSFSIGVTGHYITAIEKIEEKSDPDFNGTQTITAQVEDENTVIYPTIGIAYRTKLYGFGVSYTPSYEIDMDETKDAQASGATFFRDIEVPGKTSIGAFYQVSKKALVIVEYNLFDAPKDAILVGTGVSNFSLNSFPIEIEKSSQTVLNLGAEYVLTSSKKLDIIFRGGAYREPAKSDSNLSRTHITYGIEARMGPVVIGVSFDTAEGFQNSSQALSVSFGSI